MSRIRKSGDGFPDLLFVIGLALLTLGLTTVAAGVIPLERIGSPVALTVTSLPPQNPAPSPAPLPCAGCTCIGQIANGRSSSANESCLPQLDSAMSTVEPPRAKEAEAFESATEQVQRLTGRDDPRRFLQHMANSLRNGSATPQQGCGAPCAATP